MDDSWIGVDLDGTLAFYDEWRGVEHIGNPIPDMVDRVKYWISEGKQVRIFTARVFGEGRGDAIAPIEAWCLKHIGRVLPVTCEKDYGMVQLWDDRCVRVEQNTGRLI